MRHTCATLLTAAVLLLAGCSDDTTSPSGDPTPAPTDTTSSPTDSPTTPTAPTEPALPAAATKATEAGARAFITYYWDLINYAQVTGDVTQLRQVSGSRCRGCQAGIDAIATIYEADGRLTTADYRPTVETIAELAAEGSDAYLLKAQVKESHQEHSVFASDGAEEIYPAGTASYDTFLIWTDESWRVDVMDPR